MLATSTHPVHFAVTGVAVALDAAVLLRLNRVKADGYVPKWTWPQKKAAYWAYLAFAMALSCWMDARWEINELWLPVKGYALIFPWGLIDYYFSKNTRVSPSVLAGAGLWCSTLWLRVWLTRAIVAPDLTTVVADLWPLTLVKEGLRFVVSAALCAIFSDLIFSPMHRLEHRVMYASHHKAHHSYVNNINSLVLYHGAFLDDFMMPCTTTIGYFFFVWLCSCVGMETSAFSNVSEWLLLANTLLSHAHDERCASLILPVPDSLNFAAYHRVHHINPAKNFGLTMPSDMLFDKLLGVRTICMDEAEALAEAEKER